MLHASALAAHLDDLLGTAGVPDYPGALNGLQFANRAPIRHVAAAVDFSLRTVRAAAAAGANLLLVHHGMYWGGPHRLVGVPYEQVRTLVQHDIAVYSSHLPLDAHPVHGNNVLLARTLGLTPSAPFARHQGTAIGVAGAAELGTAALVERARTFARQHGGHVRTTDFSSDRQTRRWAICTGAGATSETLAEAEASGIDTLITGEGPHHTAVAAADRGLVVVYAGHYATETLGVRALAAHLAQTFDLACTAIDAPTGL